MLRPYTLLFPLSLPSLFSHFAIAFLCLAFFVFDFRPRTLDFLALTDTAGPIHVPRTNSFRLVGLAHRDRLVWQQDHQPTVAGVGCR